MSNQPKILAVETTARQGGIALATGPTLVDSLQFGPEADYASELLDAADRLCRRANLAPDKIEHIYVSVGPGSFTGARIGVTFAKTLAFACGARIVAVPTLQVLAGNALQLTEPPRHLVVLIDARRGQVYAQAFELDDASKGYRAKEAGKLVRLADLLGSLPTRSAVLAGLAERERDVLVAAELRPLPAELSVARAEMVHRIGWEMAQQGQFAEPLGLTPLYFRLPSPIERSRARTPRRS